MKKNKYFLFLTTSLFLIFNLSNNAVAQAKTIKFLQLNIWQEGTSVNGGFDAIVTEITALKPDFVTFSEVRNYNHTKFNERITRSLALKGEQYFSFYSNGSGILSKYPILDSSTIFSDGGTITKLITKVNNKEVAVYSAHLDYLNYAVYLPRGYSGTTWKKLAAPVTNVDSILANNLASKRDEGIAAFVNEAKQDLKQKRIVFLGGDFNEASHLDWVEETKNSFDHNGLIVPWQNSITLYKNGFKDSYRVMHSDPMNYPGFTFPAANKDVDTKKLAWAPDADERERIDFIYFFATKGLSVRSSMVVGPKASIVKNQRVEESSKDNFIEPVGVWPSDHKGVLTIFELRN